MLITQRQACEVLAGAGLSRRSAQQLLAVGLAGQPLRTRAAVLHESERVEQLTASRRWGVAELDRLCPAGWLVLRRPVPVDAPWEELRELLEPGWAAMSVWTALDLAPRLAVHGSLPVLAAVHGFVLTGAELVGLCPGRRLRLREPGEWFEQVRGCRIPSPPGRPWHFSLAGSSVGGSMGATCDPAGGRVRIAG